MNIVVYTFAFEFNECGYVIFYPSFCNFLHFFGLYSIEQDIGHYLIMQLGMVYCIYSGRHN